MEPNDGKRFAMQWTEVVRHEAVLSEETIKDLGMDIVGINGEPFLVCQDGDDDAHFKNYLIHLEGTDTTGATTISRVWDSDLVRTQAPETEADHAAMVFADAPRPE